MTTKNRYHYSSHCVFNLGYHIIWCPKYRRKVLVNGIDERLKELLCQKALQIGVTIEKMEVMPDHVHFMIQAPATIAPAQIAKIVKGCSQASIKKLIPTFIGWSKGYYISSVGGNSIEAVEKYIKNQKS